MCIRDRDKLVGKPPETRKSKYKCRDVYKRQVEKIVRDVFPNADAILNEKDKSKKKETKKVDEEVNDLPF